MGLYLDSGYLNFDYIINNTDSPFIFIYGGRGTGKTYGAIKWLIENNETAIFMRRTGKEAEAVLNNAKLSTALQVFNDLNLEININKISKDNAVTAYIKDDEAIPVYISCSLTGVAGIRGYSNENIKYIIYDEFIKEKHIKAIRGEGEALLNAYETFNRNRELKGLPPIRVICMSNADDIFNPIFKTFGITKNCFNMKKRGKHFSLLKDGLISIYDLSDSPISTLKKETVLYKLGAEDFNKMAIDNTFDTPDEIIRSENIKGYKPLCTYGDYTFYNAKGHFYVSAFGKTNPYFNNDDKGKRALLNTFPFLKYAYLRDMITGETIDAVGAIKELFN